MKNLPLQTQKISKISTATAEALKSTNNLKKWLIRLITLFLLLIVTQMKQLTSALPDGHMTAIGDMPPKIHDELQQAGFSINQGPDIITHSSVDVLTPSGTHVDTITGHSTTIPNGTEWIHDPSDQSKWDLVVSGNPDKTLISDAQFDATGKIVDWDHANSMDSIISVSDTTGEPQIITGGQAVDEWLRHGTQIDHREWYSYDQPE